jgi:hypothetical protein
MAETTSVISDPVEVIELGKPVASPVASPAALPPFAVLSTAVDLEGEVVEQKKLLMRIGEYR